MWHRRTANWKRTTTSVGGSESAPQTFDGWSQRASNCIACTSGAPTTWISHGRPIEGKDFEENVRYIYCANVLKWGLPMDAALAGTIERIFSPEVLTEYAERIEAAKALERPASESDTEPQTPSP